MQSHPGCERDPAEEFVQLRDVTRKLWISERERIRHG